MQLAGQTTLRDHTTLLGVGVHSGLPVTLTIHPADAGTGLRFIRTGLEGNHHREIPADMDAVTATEFATVLGDANGPLISTAEHVLAALSGLAWTTPSLRSTVRRRQSWMAVLGRLSLQSTWSA